LSQNPTNHQKHEQQVTNPINPNIKIYQDHYCLLFVEKITTSPFQKICNQNSKGQKSISVSISIRIFFSKKQ